MDETKPGIAQNHTLIGNRLALSGAVIYLLEWVVIIAAAPPGPFGPSTDSTEIVDLYAEHPRAAAFSAAWFAVCLVGRVLYVSGLKASMRTRRDELPLLDLAVAAMAISVVLEVSSYCVAAGAAGLAADGADDGVVLALDAAGYWLNVGGFAPLGVSIMAAGAAMLRSRLFASWLCWLPIVAGAAAIAGCIVTGASAGEEGTSVADALTTVAALGMWAWMIVTGVKLWRLRPLRTSA